MLSEVGLEMRVDVVLKAGRLRGGWRCLMPLLLICTWSFVDRLIASPPHASVYPATNQTQSMPTGS